MQAPAGFVPFPDQGPFLSTFADALGRAIEADAVEGREIVRARAVWVVAG